MVNLDSESPKVFLDLSILITSTLLNSSIKLQTFWWYKIIFAPFTMQSPLVWFTTNYESLNTLSLLSPTIFASLNHVIRASYLASLLEALNLKWRAYSNWMWCSSSPFSIKSMPNPRRLEESPTCNSQLVASFSS